MKTLLILFLFGAFMGATSVSRPNEASFRQMARTELQSSASGFWQKLTVDSKINNFFDDSSFRDRVLWTQVDHEAGATFVGVLGHWFQLEGWGPTNVRSAYPQDVATLKKEKELKRVASVAFGYGR